MEKLDLKKSMQPLYQPSARKVVEVDVPEARFLMVDGTGDPNTSPDYAAAIEALYAVAYAIKFAVRKGPLAIDYGVMPLEGLWWADDPASFTTGSKQDWKWTMMICQPAFVTAGLIEQTIAEVRARKNPPALDRLRVDTLVEGRCAQILHVGPFTEEGPTVEKLHQFIAAHGQMRGRHHEIYLSNIRKAAPQNWKTILRHPMQ